MWWYDQFEPEILDLPDYLVLSGKSTHSVCVVGQPLTDCLLCGYLQVISCFFAFFFFFSGPPAEGGKHSSPAQFPWARQTRAIVEVYRFLAKTRFLNDGSLNPKSSKIRHFSFRNDFRRDASRPRGSLIRYMVAVLFCSPRISFW